LRNKPFEHENKIGALDVLATITRLLRVGQITVTEDAGCNVRAGSVERRATAVLAAIVDLSQSRKQPEMPSGRREHQLEDGGIGRDDNRGSAGTALLPNDVLLLLS
jgi:hypothetical protein